MQEIPRDSLSITANLKITYSTCSCLSPVLLTVNFRRGTILREIEHRYGGHQSSDTLKKGEEGVDKIAGNCGDWAESLGSGDSVTREITSE